MSLHPSLAGRLSLPVVASPMFLVSGPQLVTEACRQGVIGSFPALNQRTSELFEQWLIEIKDNLAAFEAENGRPAAPYGVNLIVHQTNPRWPADLELCIKHQVPLVITSLGAVGDLVEKVHGYGGLVFHDITNKRHARKAAAAGVDGLILVAAGAGGHAGTASPFALVHEIREFFAGTILLAGCLNNGRDVATALQMGADLAYMGTRFINTLESLASDDYKQMIIDTEIKDVVYTAAVSGIPANFLYPSLTEAGFDQEMLMAQKKIDLGEELSEARAWKTIWSAGQGVTGINDVVPVADLIERLKAEFAAAVADHLEVTQRYLAAAPSNSFSSPEFEG